MMLVVCVLCASVRRERERGWFESLPEVLLAKMSVPISNLSRVLISVTRTDLYTNSIDVLHDDDDYDDIRQEEHF